jgi:hypothetical protein
LAERKGQGHKEAQQTQKRPLHRGVSGFGRASIHCCSLTASSVFPSRE